MTTIKPHVTRFYATLEVMGINMANQPYTVPQRVNDAINAIEDVPEEWWEHMIEFGREHGVKDPMKVITGLEKWTADGGPPALRQVKAKDSEYMRSEEFIGNYMLSRPRCRCTNFPECQPAWRKKVLEARKQQTGVA